MSVQKQFAAAWAAARSIEGWLSETQAHVLFEAATAVQPGCAIVEIGSHRGRSAVVLALAARDGVGICAVDPFEDARWGGGSESHAILLRNLEEAGVSQRITTVRETSAAAALGWSGSPIGLVYVDGAHEREAVLADIDGWIPHLVVGGFAAFHDAFSSPGVTLALLQRFLSRDDFAYVRSARSLVLLRRTRPSRLGRVRLALRLAARLPYFARNLLVKIALRRNWRAVRLALGHRADEAPY